ncbi:MAG: spherulation-specific family 4 protein [Aquificaceae bacterium]|nr:spherulation-specific family 4 protein [Aquificaceae bacterium]
MIWILVILAGCGGGSGRKETNTGETVGITTILIPLYSYPVGEYEDEHRKLAQLQTNKEIILVANPDNGPGSRLDENYTRLIRTYKERGFKVVGYLFTNYGSRSLQAVREDMDKYMRFYPQVDGFFVDEVSNSTSKLDYYREIAQYSRLLGKSLLVFNPGTRVPVEYYTLADRIVVFEQSAEFMFRNYGGYTANPKDCFLVYGVGNRNLAEEAYNFVRSRGGRMLVYVKRKPSQLV